MCYVCGCAWATWTPDSDRWLLGRARFTERLETAVVVVSQVGV